MLLQKAGVESHYQIINIDTLQGRIPQYITCVPTLIVDSRNKLTDDKLFQYIESNIQTTQVGDSGYFEGHYSFVDGTENTQPSRSFADIETPMTTTSPMLLNNTFGDKDKVNDKAYEAFLLQRGREVSTNHKPSDAEVKKLYDQVFPPQIA